MKVNGEELCKCGQPARPNGRNCRTCHNASMRQSRLKAKLNLERIEQQIDEFTIVDPATRAAFESKLKSRWVIIRGDAKTPDIAGGVVAFLPSKQLKVMDASGEIHNTTLDQVIADPDRPWRLRPYTKTKAALGANNGEQAGEGVGFPDHWLGLTREDTKNISGFKLFPPGTF